LNAKTDAIAAEDGRVADTAAQHRLADPAKRGCGDITAAAEMSVPALQRPPDKLFQPKIE